MRIGGSQYGKGARIVNIKGPEKVRGIPRTSTLRLHLNDSTKPELGKLSKVF